MRGIILVAVCLLALLAATLVGVWFICRAAEETAAYIPGLAAAIRSEDWERALLLYERCEARFRAAQRWWKMMINHDDMRDVEAAFVDLRVALENKNSFEAQKELADLKFFLEHVPDTERVNLGNVL